MSHALDSQTHSLKSTDSPDLFNVVMPAGGRISGAFAEAAKTEFKSLTIWQGQSLLKRTVHQLQQSGIINRVLVIGPQEVLNEAQSCGAEGIAEGSSGPDNLFLGLEYLLKSEKNTANKVLICASDMPALSSNSIQWFVENSPAESDITVPVITASDYEKAYPQSGSVYVPVKDGASTMGCLFLLRPEAIMNQKKRIDEVFRSRKSQWNTFQMLGPMFLLKYITRQLSINDIERRCEEILGWKGRAVRNAPPDLACDIDTLEDYNYLKRLICDEEDSVQ